MFSPIIRRTKIPAKIVVILRFVNTPIKSLFRVNHQRGIRGRGSSRLRATWLYTRMMSGFNPRRMAIVVGIVLTNLVTRRLIHGLIFFPSIPSMIAWPANVPVVDEDNPDDRRVIPKITAAVGPKRGSRVLFALSLGGTGSSGKTAAGALVTLSR